MIDEGFDRPLKPEWIYQIINLLEIGDITIRNDVLNGF